MSMFTNSNNVVKISSGDGMLVLVITISDTITSTARQPARHAEDTSDNGPSTSTRIMMLGTQ